MEREIRSMTYWSTYTNSTGSPKMHETYTISLLYICTLTNKLGLIKGFSIIQDTSLAHICFNLKIFQSF